jgi:DNA-binding CsgD family transcriptional regulator
MPTRIRAGAGTARATLEAVDDTLLGLVELLFHAPEDDRAGNRFLGALSDAISPEARAVVLVEDPAGVTLVFAGGEPRLVPGRLPRREIGRRIERLPRGTVFDLPPLPRESAEDPTVVGVVEPEGLLPGPGLGMMGGNEQGRATSILLVLPRSGAWEPTARDRELLTRLAPFVVQSAHLRLRLLSSGTLTALLDQLVLGVVLSDAQGRVTYVNQSAAEILGIEPGESAPEPGAPLDARSKALYRTIRPTTEGESLFAHPADGRPLHVLITRLNWPASGGYARHRHARALFIGDPKRGTSDPLGNLGQAYGLTTQEARLAALLVGDYTLAQAAQQLGITESTARTVLKRVLAKTGTRRQASLVRLLLAGPAQIRADRPRPARDPGPESGR